MTTETDFHPARHAAHEIEPGPIDDGRPSWFPRRRAGRWLAGVVVAVALAELAARLVVPHTSPEIRWYDAATQLRVEMMDARDVDGDDEVDVVFAGTSSAWQAFVPAPFAAASGQPAFNAGLAGAVPVVTGPWLVDQVEPRLRPDTVVWGLTALDLADGYGDDQQQAYERAVETDDRWLARADRAVSSVSELVRSRRLLRSAGTLVGDEADERRELHRAAAEVTGPDGERLDFGAPDPNDAAIQRARLADFGIDADDVAALRTATTELQRRGVRVVFVDLPVPTRFRDLLGPDDVAAVSATIRSLGSELGVDVVGLRDAFADEAFVDDTHLDQAGTLDATGLLAIGLARLEDVAAGRCEPLGATDDFGFEWNAEVCRHRSD